MGTIEIGKTKIDNTTESSKAVTPAAPLNASVNEPEVSETVSKSPKPDATATAGKHVVIYLAGGIWKDHEEQYWCRDKKGNCIQAKTFTEDELKARPDIQFMIEYGAMKDTIAE